MYNIMAIDVIKYQVRVKVDYAFIYVMYSIYCILLYTFFFDYAIMQGKWLSIFLQNVVEWRSSIAENGTSKLNKIK